MKQIQSNIENKINAYISDNKVTGMVCDHLLSNLNQDGDYWWYLEPDGDYELTGEDKDNVEYYIKAKHCRFVINGKDASFLTVEDAERLKGCRITTYYEGYGGQDGMDSFVVGDVVSELEYYRNLKEDCYPDGKYNNRAEYWESYMTKEQLDIHRDKMLLLREDGSNTFIYTYSDIFCCSDDDRWVYYVEVETNKSGIMERKQVEMIINSASDIIKRNGGSINIRKPKDSLFYYIGGLPVGDTVESYLTEAVWRELTTDSREDYMKWRNEHFTQIKSTVCFGPRGEYYTYADLFDGKVFAIGREEGNYAGGRICSIYNNGREMLVSVIERFSKSDDVMESSLYDQIKDIEVISNNEFESVMRNRERWPEEFDTWNWFN